MLPPEKKNKKLPSPPQAVFNCSMCGECCTSVTVPIEKEKAHRLLEKPWVKTQLKESHRVFEELDDTHYAMPLDDNRVCVFLGEDKKCMIHGHEGEALKPVECIRFPFAAIRMPRLDKDSEEETPTLRYDVSASCKTVATQLLTQQATIVPNKAFATQFQNDLAAMVHEEAFPQKIRVGGFKTVALDGYQLYLDELVRIFEDPIGSPELALKRTAQVLQSLPNRPKTQVKSFQFWPFWRHFSLYWFLRRPYGIMDQWAVLTEGEYSDPKILGMGGISLKGHRRLKWDEHQLNPLLNGYLHILLQRKALLAFGHSLASVLLIAVSGYFLVQWYARTLALVQEKDEVTEEELTLAIRLTERYYTGHQPYFLEFFRVFPGVEGCLWLSMG